LKLMFFWLSFPVLPPFRYPSHCIFNHVFLGALMNIQKIRKRKFLYPVCLLYLKFASICLRLLEHSVVWNGSYTLLEWRRTRALLYLGLRVQSSSSTFVILYH
jgi:hypothetical protein